MRNYRRKRSLKITDFEIGKCIGKGRFGQVFIGKHWETNRIVVLKRLVKKEIIEENLLGQVRREIEIHYRLRHPHIIRLFCYFEDESYLFLVEEFASNGELFKHLQEAGRFTERKVSNYIRQLSSVLKHIHSKGILHRDIKPENILVMSDGSLKLADFGYVVKINTQKGRRTTQCGTLDYFSPEMIEGIEYNHSVDLWALGILAYELLVGKAPFYEKRENETLRKIRKGKLRFPNYVSRDAKDFIRRLLRKEDYRRMNASEALRHKFITKYL